MQLNLLMILFSIELELIPNKISLWLERIVRYIKPANDFLYEWFGKRAVNKGVVDWVIFPKKAAFLISFKCKWLKALPRACRKRLGWFRKARKLCLQIGCTLPRVREVCDAWKWLAGFPRVSRKSLGLFWNARKLYPLWACACACAAPYLGYPKFVTL